MALQAGTVFILQGLIRVSTRQGIRELHDLGTTFDQLKNRTKDWSRVSIEATSALAASMGAVIGQGFMAVQKSIMDFDHAMRAVHTITDMTEDQFKSFSNEVAGLTEKFDLATDSIENAKALYEIMQAGVKDTAQAQELLVIASRAATGGMVETAQAADVITSVMNAYGMSVGEAAHISDVLFKTIDVGKTTFSELSTQLGDVMGIAAAAGISFEELSATVATVTKQGVPTSKSTTAIRAAISHLINPSKEAMGVMQKYGLVIDQVSIQHEGLIGTMQKIATATHGDKQAMGEILGDVNAVDVAFKLLANDGKLAADALNQITNEAGGKSAEAAEKMGKSITVEFEKIKAALIDLALTFRDELGPQLIGGAKWAQGFIKDIKDMDPVLRNSIATGILLAGAFSGLMVTVGVLGNGLLGMIGTMIRVAGAVGLTTTATKGLSIAQGAGVVATRASIMASIQAGAAQSTHSAMTMANAGAQRALALSLGATVLAMGAVLVIGLQYNEWLLAKIKLEEANQAAIKQSVAHYHQAHQAQQEWLGKGAEELHRMNVSSTDLTKAIAGIKNELQTVKELDMDEDLKKRKVAELEAQLKSLTKTLQDVIALEKLWGKPTGQTGVPKDKYEEMADIEEKERQNRIQASRDAYAKFAEDQKNQVFESARAEYNIWLQTLPKIQRYKDEVNKVESEEYIAMMAEKVRLEREVAEEWADEKRKKDNERYQNEMNLIDMALAAHRASKEETVKGLEELAKKWKHLISPEQFRDLQLKIARMQGDILEDAQQAEKEAEAERKRLHAEAMAREKARWNAIKQANDAVAKGIDAELDLLKKRNGTEEEMIALLNKKRDAVLAAIEAERQQALVGAKSTEERMAINAEADAKNKRANTEYAEGVKDVEKIELERANRIRDAEDKIRQGKLDEIEDKERDLERTEEKSGEKDVAAREKLIKERAKLRLQELRDQQKQAMDEAELEDRGDEEKFLIRKAFLMEEANLARDLKAELQALREERNADKEEAPVQTLAEAMADINEQMGFKKGSFGHSNLGTGGSVFGSSGLPSSLESSVTGMTNSSDISTKTPNATAGQAQNIEGSKTFTTNVVIKVDMDGKIKVVKGEMSETTANGLFTDSMRMAGLFGDGAASIGSQS